MPLSKNPSGICHNSEISRMKKAAPQRRTDRFPMVPRATCTWRAYFAEASRAMTIRVLLLK
jgi:hypothetical protein